MIAMVIGAAVLAIASIAVGRTPLGALNFGLLQWFGVRLQASFEPDLVAHVVVAGDLVLPPGPGRWWSRYAPPRDVPVSWSLRRWVVPLTGWWSPYRRIALRGWLVWIWPLRKRGGR